MAFLKNKEKKRYCHKTVRTLSAIFCLIVIEDDLDGQGRNLKEEMMEIPSQDHQKMCYFDVHLHRCRCQTVFLRHNPALCFKDDVFLSIWILFTYMLIRTIRCRAVQFFRMNCFLLR